MLLGLFAGAAIAYTGLYALYLTIALIGCAFILLDFRVGVVLLIVVVPISRSAFFRTRCSALRAPIRQPVMAVSWSRTCCSRCRRGPAPVRSRAARMAVHRAHCHRRRDRVFHVEEIAPAFYLTERR